MGEKYPAVVAFIAAIMIGICLYYLGILGSYSYRTLVAYNALIAFISMIVTGLILVARRSFKLSWQYPIHIPFLFIGIIHIGGSIGAMVAARAPNQITASIPVGDLLKSLVFLFLLVLTLRDDENYRIKKLLEKASFRMVLIIIPTFSLFFLYYSILPELTPEQLTVISVIASILIVVLLLALAQMTKKLGSFLKGVKYEYLVVVGSILVIAVIPLFLSLFIDTQLWMLSLNYQSIAMMLFLAVLAIPIFEEYGSSKQLGIAYVIALLLLAVLPFLATISLEIVTYGAEYLDFNLYALSIFLGIFISIQMIILLFLYSRRNPNPVHTPLILIFVNWAVIDINTLLFQIPSIMNGETVTQWGEIFGSVFTIVYLVIAISWTKNKPSMRYSPESRIIAAIALFGLTMVLITNAFFVQDLRSNDLFIHGHTLLLFLNLIAIFLFSYIIFLRASIVVAQLRIETISIIVLSLWIIPNVLISVYGMWTAGWWVANLTRVVGLSLGPLLLGIAYLQWMFAAESAQKRATVFSDLLVHDIRNYHQTALSAIDLVEMKSEKPDLYQEHIDAIKRTLGNANFLIGNVERMLRITEEERVQLSRYDIVKKIRDSFELLTSNGNSSNVTLELDLENDQYYVLADHFINDIFMNLLLNSIQHSPDDARIRIEIESQDDDESFWSIRIIDFGSGIHPDKQEGLFSRYMKGARGSGLGLSVVKSLVERYGGSVRMMDRVPDDYTQGAIFEVRLQKG